MNYRIAFAIASFVAVCFAVAAWSASRNVRRLDNELRDARANATTVLDRNIAVEKENERLRKLASDRATELERAVKQLAELEPEKRVTAPLGPRRQGILAELRRLGLHWIEAENNVGESVYRTGLFTDLIVEPADRPTWIKVVQLPGPEGENLPQLKETISAVLAVVAPQWRDRNVWCDRYVVDEPDNAGVMTLRSAGAIQLGFAQESGERIFMVTGALIEPPPFSH